MVKFLRRRTAAPVCGAMTADGWPCQNPAGCSVDHQPRTASPTGATRGADTATTADLFDTQVRQAEAAARRQVAARARAGQRAGDETYQQWVNEALEHKRRQQVTIDHNNGLSEQYGLFDQSGYRIKAKLCQNPRDGGCYWALLDHGGNRVSTVSHNDAAIAGRGMYLADETVPAIMTLAAGDQPGELAPQVTRIDGGYPPDAVPYVR